VDGNLELALVEQLLRDGTVTFDRDVFLVTHPPEKEADDEGDEAHLYRKNLDIDFALRRLLTPEHLPAIPYVLWEGGMTTQHLVWNYWDGEDAAFDIESLEGIEACTALTSLSICNTHAIRDLSPLAALRGLEVIRIAGGGHARLIEDVSPLTALPRLRTLDLSSNRTLNNVSRLAEITSLETLDLAGCAVEDYAFATDLPKLRTLVVGAGASTANAPTFATLRERGVTVRERGVTVRARR
jgi:hypothetical protein